LICLTIIGDPDFCLNRIDGNYQRDPSRRNFTFYACVSNRCFKKECPRPDLEFDEKEGKCVEEDFNN